MEEAHLDAVKLQVDCTRRYFHGLQAVEIAQTVAQRGRIEFRVTEQIEISRAAVAKLEGQAGTSRQVKTFEHGP